MAITEPIEPPMTRKPVHVSIVVFPECDPSIIYGVYDTLWAAGRAWEVGQGFGEGSQLFQPRIVAAEKAPLALITGTSILPHDGIKDVRRTDVVFVPNVLVANGRQLGALDRRLLRWISRMHQGGAQISAACGGSLVLAEAGLLDGGETTTHWSYVPLFRERFPKVTLHAERILVQSGRERSIMCSGGASAWQDLALLMISRHGGVDEAIRISKMFLYQWHRDGQLPFNSMVQNSEHGDAAILRCQAWLAQNYERSDVVAQMVAQSGLPKRSFDRRFRAATGYSPLSYVQALRIEEAKQLLERGTAAVAAVGREVGYADSASFRRLFRRLAGMGPGDYRKKFQVPAMVAKAAPQRATPRRPRTVAIRLRSGNSGQSRMKNGRAGRPAI
jgi:transcriptional regulator GlxA family with amidase domain